jgi:CubicO group peptidase (beta-lactamase class C family)
VKIALGYMGTTVLLLSGCVQPVHLNKNAMIMVEKRGHAMRVKTSGRGLGLDTPFLIGSLTKQFTGVLCLKHLSSLLDADVTTRMMEQDFESVFQSVSDVDLWEPLNFFHFKGVTVKQLLTHSAALDYNTGEKVAKFKYQNLNFNLLGKILENVTGQSYTNLSRALFQQAGMTNTGFHSDFSSIQLAKKLGYINVCFDALTESMNPSGGIISTARDLLRWNDFLAKNNYFEQLTAYTVDANEPEFLGRYGFGILVLENNKNKIFFHNGAIILPNGPSFTSFLSYDPNRKASTVCFEILEANPCE